LESEVDESEQQKKREQIEKGLCKGHAELVKMSKCQNTSCRHHLASTLC
jgi:hypothetical protein